MPRAIKQIKWKVCENGTRYWRGGRMLQAIWHCGHVVFSVPVVICCILQYTAVMFFILAAWAQANVTVQLRGDTYDSWPCRLSSKTDLPILLFFFFPATEASAFSCSRGERKKKKARLSLQPCFVSNLNASVSARVSAALMKLQFGVMILNLLRFPAHVVLATLIEGFALL